MENLREISLILRKRSRGYNGNWWYRMEKLRTNWHDRTGFGVSERMSFTLDKVHENTEPNESDLFAPTNTDAQTILEITMFRIFVFSVFSFVHVLVNFYTFRYILWALSLLGAVGSLTLHSSPSLSLSCLFALGHSAVGCRLRVNVCACVVVCVFLFFVLHIDHFHFPFMRSMFTSFSDDLEGDDFSFEFLVVHCTGC